MSIPGTRDFHHGLLGNPMAGRVLFVTVWVCVVWVTQWFTLLQLSRPRLRTNLKLLAGLFLMPVFSIPLQGLVEAAENGSVPGVLDVAGRGVGQPPVQGLIVGCLLVLYWFHARRQSPSTEELGATRTAAWLGSWVFAGTLGSSPPQQWEAGPLRGRETMAAWGAVECPQVISVSCSVWPQDSCC